MANAHDFSTLNWIKGELDETLRHARRELEDYVEGSGNPALIESCADRMHQIRGTLQMVQVYGPAMLAEEMELVARAMLSEQVTNKSDAAEALMLALVQVPDYLEKLQAGGQDIPLVVLPLINDLRATRGVPLLSEAALFAPDLDSGTHPGDAPNPALPGLVHQLRPQFQRGFVGWHRGVALEHSFKLLRKVFSELTTEAHTTPVRNLFWVAQAVMEGLLEQSIEVGTAVKAIVGRIDRELKQIAESGESDEPPQSTRDLLKNLLYYVAQAETDNELIAEVKEAFHLDSALPSRAEIEAGRERLSAPGTELLHSVTDAVVAELTQIKDSLDLFIRGGRDQLNKLYALEQPLRKVGDTLGMVGQGGLRTRLVHRADAIETMRETAAAPTENELMEVAGDLLYVESSMANLSVGSLGAEDSTGKTSHTAVELPQGEFESLVGDTLHEASVDMAKAKDAIVCFLQAPTETGYLEPVPGQFRSVSGALRILGRSDAAEILDEANAYLKTHLIDGQEVPEQSNLNALADVITSVEYYMEGLAERRGNLPEILDIARQALRKLRPETRDQEAAAQEDGLAGMTAFKVIDLSSGEPQESIETGEPELPHEVAIEPIDEDVAEIEISSEAPAEDQPELPSADKPPMEEVDPEILDIFIEEAREELEVIQEQVPRWLQNSDNKDALATFRRSFHTLKGSGRLVGAKTIGEFAWSVENLLNRVIDETLTLSPSICELVDTAKTVLPELIDCQVEGRTPDFDLQAFMDKAHALAEDREQPTEATATPAETESDEGVADRLGDEGIVQTDNVIQLQIAEAETKTEGASEDHLSPTEGTDDSVDLRELLPHEIDTEEEEETVENEVIAEQESPEPALSLDNDLLEIFHAETRKHLDALNGFVDECREKSPPCDISEKISVAFHTLHGSAHMAGVLPIAEVSDALEDYVNELKSKGLSADQGVIGLIVDGVGVIERVLSAINVAGSELPDYQSLLERLHEARSAMPAVPEIEQHETEVLVASEDLDAPVEEIQLEGQAPNPEAEPDLLAADEDETEVEIQASATTDFAEADVDIDSVADERQLAEDEEIIEQPEPIVELEDPEAIELVSETRQDDEPPEIDKASVSPQQEEETGDKGELTVSHIENDEPDEEIAAESAEKAQIDSDEVVVEVGGDEELVEIFLEEAHELLDALETSLQELRSDRASKEPLESLQRTLHTLKGGARLAGIMPVGDLSHAFESFLTGLVNDRLKLSDAVFDLVHSAANRLSTQIEEVSAGGPVHRADNLLFQLEAVLAGGGDSGAKGEREAKRKEQQSAVATVEEKKDSGEKVKKKDKKKDKESRAERKKAPSDDQSGATETPPTTVTRPTPAPSKPAPPVKEEQVRVRSGLLDRLVNNAGEVSIYRSRLEEQNSTLGFNLGELEQTVSRLRAQLRQLEIETEAQILFRYEREQKDQDSPDKDFDPLELDRFSTMQQLSRSLIETVEDLVSIRNLLSDQQRETETLLLQQSRISTDLQDGLLRTRMVPFSQLVPRLHRVVRQTSDQLGKKTVLEVHGAEGEMDRSILERMVAPLEHLLRNAVSHGIETPEVREARGKQETGRISLYLSREGTDVVLSLSDDGKGLDLEAIRERAVERGLLADKAEVSDDDLMQFVLEHGFSTADQVTQISGRGVGMDVVASEVKQLGGSFEIASQSGRGTSFTVRLPLTLAITEALLVEMIEDIFAVPHTSIEGVVRISRKELQACYDGSLNGFVYAGHTYKVLYMGDLLGTSGVDLSDNAKWYPLLLVRTGEHRVGLQVDGLLGNRQIVVKSVGAQLSSVRWITGGTILGDGRVALIVDVGALVRMGIAQAGAPAVEAKKDQGRRVNVMVVDDSITVRKVTTRLLDRHNMQVLTAKDGVDAVALLQDQLPDVMLLDIEMPRMDGYELARHMRNSERLQHIPIIMITSRTGDKHRQRAFDLGVKRYLGKPYQETDLLDNIYSVLAESSA